MSSPRRRAATLLPVVAALAWLSAAAAPAATPAERARGGHRLLESLEGRGVGVVGRVGEITRLDTHGWAARIWVERVLGPDAARYPEGEPLRIAWEELATGRPPRFSDTDRVLVVLERLSTASIWRARIDDPAQRRQTLGIAEAGEAFLRDPVVASLDVLHHYLAIPPADREGAAGARYLVALAERAQLPLAVGAARRLGRMPGLAGHLGPPEEASLVDALERGDVDPQLTAALLLVFEAARSGSLAKELARRSAARDPAAPARLFEALARVRAEGLTPRETAWLLARPEADYRAVVAHNASARDVDALRTLRAGDTDAKVRGSALQRLVTLFGEDALPDALASLADPAPGVRAVAARSAGSMGGPAVDSLRDVAYGRAACCEGSAEAPRAAIAGLRVAGPGGRRVLARIAADHPDPSLRKLADLALGELKTHEH